MRLKDFINPINPKKLFLVDSMGALISTIMLGFVLTRFENIIGMPPKVLYLLSGIACILCIYSLICFKRDVKNWRFYLTIIGIANLVYCCLSLGFMLFYYHKLTFLGLTYFILEKIIVIILAFIELKTAFRANL
jgi:hypothetical protein